ncbi:hypothetical protein N7519_006845 [Penicillium mononematosum]|uniref:uncharacterized protein n=1 Tax=Penicillium mononematosum TaxID=268346 RepID=UPI0025497A3F|nr:uncharacterized protein N7519_006845 [Penicillium mononematosum]KAJ6185544.1 hypothetical protein N7519_006845 [Penicillium mononematosum]
MTIESLSPGALTGEEPEIVMQAFAYHHMVAKVRGEHKRNKVLPLPTPGLHTELVTDSLGGNLCSNAHRRDGILTPDPDLEAEAKDFLWQRLAKFSLECNIRRCEHADCLIAKGVMTKAAPPCNWTAFREWALTVVSCQASFTPKQKISAAHMQMARAASGCSLILKSWANATNLGVRSFAQPSLNGQVIDMAGVCSLIYWMLSIQADLGVGPRDFGQWDRSLVPPAATLPAIVTAHQQLSQFNICRRRLWAIVNQSDRRDGDLPDLVVAIKRHARALSQKDHGLCTSSKCQQAHMNTTRTSQMHKCPSTRCRDRTIPTERVPAAVELGHRTAWDTAGKQLCGADDEYIAISHVWSDGTGAGGKNPGTVNECLFNFFRDLAIHYDCKAFWWDVICVPFERRARDRALGVMHTNYRDAKCTVVHDNYLLSFPWSDDGGPCLALVLSPWFSRGWTALELAVSRKVEVLFGDGKGGWVYKDLDDEILAKSPGTSSRAHWLASVLIRRVRRRIENIGDLIAILRPRSTAYTRDRTGIAALLANVPDCDLSRRESEITERILQHVGRIPYGCLLHGASTIRDSGAFSWAPATLDEMPMDLSADLQVDTTAKDRHQLKITEEGAIEGFWWYRAVNGEDMETKRIVPLGDNLESIVKVHSSLTDWDKCILLRFKQNMDTAVLATTVKTDRSEAGVTGAQTRWTWGQVTLGDDVVDWDNNVDWDDVVDWYNVEWGNRKWEGKQANGDVEGGTVADADGESDEGSGADVDQVAPAKLPLVLASEAIEAIEHEQGRDAGKTGYTVGGLINAVASQLASNDEGGKVSATGPDHPFQGAPLDLFSIKWILQRVKNLDRREQHLLVAIAERDENAMQYLIRDGVRLESSVVVDLAAEIGTKTRSIYENLLVLGQVYRRNSVWEKAEDILQVVIGRFEELKEEDVRYHSFSHIAKSALASILEARGEPDKAIDLYRQVLNYYRDAIDLLEVLMGALPELEGDLIYGAEESHIDYSMPFIGSLTNSSWNDDIKLKTITDLTVLYAEQGRLTEAESVFKKAIATVGSDFHVPCFALDWTDKYLKNFACRKRVYARHEKTYKRALWQFKRLLGDHHPWRLSALANAPKNLIRYARYFYGKFLVAQNRIQAAQGQFSLVLSGFPDELRDAESFRFAALMQKGICLLYQTKYQNSLPLFDAALDGFQRCNMDKGVFNIVKSTTRQSQAWAMFRLARSEEERIEAISLCQGVLEDQEESWEKSRSANPAERENIPTSHEGIAESQLCLGIMYTLKGEFVKAREILGKALHAFEQVVGNSDIRTLATAYRLGLAYKEQSLVETDREAGVDLHTLAIKQLETVMMGSFKVLGPFHTPTLKPAMALGQIYMALAGFATIPRSFDDVKEHFGKAQEYFETALARFETTHAADYPVTFELEQALGNALRMQGMLSEAEGKLRYAVVNFHHRGETYKISEAHALSDLGHVYLDRENWDKARDSYDKALKICQDHADDHLATMQQVYLGESEHGPNTDGAYNGLQQLAKEPRATVVTRLDAAAWLGDMYQRKPDNATARRWLEQAFEGYLTHLYPDHSSTIRVYQRLGQLYQALHLKLEGKTLIRKYNLATRGPGWRGTKPQ